jgi:hypothetical protein
MTMPPETRNKSGWYSPPVPKAARALKAWRADNADEEIRNYHAVTFPRDPRGGCDLHLRRLGAFGMIADGYTGLAVDAIDEKYDILETWALTPDGMRYLRRELNLRMEPRHER